MNLPSILAFDVESNGLAGPAFAVGAVWYDPEGACRETFFARCPIEGDVDPFVRAHVLPALVAPEAAPTHPTAHAMRDAFWAWAAARWRTPGLVTLVDCGWPVDTGILTACLCDDPRRANEGPYPLHDAASFLYAAGYHPLHNYAPVVYPEAPANPHHPVYDAHVSARCARMALLTLAERGITFV